MTDSYKGITNIRYNHTLLPDKVTLTNGRTIEWVMTASGETLRKVVKQNGTTLLTRDYIDGIEYLDGVMEAIYHSEGRVKYTNGTARYEYTMRDHLGNGRVYYTDLDGNGIGTPSDILQSESYYDFGLQIDDPREQVGNPNNPYQYNGKELNTDFGLNWHAYGARYYDAAVGRFTSVDPLAEKYAAWTPYHYVHNNPLRYTDPDGRQADDIIVDGQKYVPGAAPAVGSSKFVTETFAALNQVVNGSDKQAANLVTGLANNSNIEVDIVSSNVTTEAMVGLGVIGGKDVMRKFQTVYFDTDRGIEETATGKTFSPDVALVHELGHIQNAIDSPTDFINRKASPDPVWGNLEEKQTTTKYEVPYAASRGMLQRTGYATGYKLVKTINSTNAITPKQLGNIMRAVLGF